LFQPRVSQIFGKEVWSGTKFAIEILKFVQYPMMYLKKRIFNRLQRRRLSYRMIRRWADFVSNIPFVRSRILASLYDRAAASFSFPPGNDRDDSDNLIADSPCCVYVHFPFCTSACTYCAFSKTLRTDLSQSYCESLLREIELFGRTKVKPGARLTSVYFGGGTPSLMPPAMLSKICSRIHEAFPHNPQPQITLECSPESLEPNHVADYLRMGINRLSIGVQSFHADALAEMGRQPHPDRIRQVLKALPGRGLTNFSVDLMYGFKSQNREAFLIDLHKAMELGPHHITLYPLVASGGSSHSARKRERKQQEMYHAAQKVLAGAGYEQYSTEDFALHASARDRYEMDSWMVPSKGVVVFGTAGFGTLNHRSYTKERDIAAYNGIVDQGRFASSSCRLIDKNKEARIRTLLGLRYLNVNRDDLRKVCEIDPWSVKDEMLGFLKGLGLIESDEKNLRLRKDEYFRYSLLWAKIMLGRLDGNLTAGKAGANKSANG
jgi:oxygen-independent coproporphyrinogen III oxidase